MSNGGGAGQRAGRKHQRGRAGGDDERRPGKREYRNPHLCPADGARSGAGAGVYPPPRRIALRLRISWIERRRPRRHRPDVRAPADGGVTMRSTLTPTSEILLPVAARHALLVSSDMAVLRTVQQIFGDLSVETTVARDAQHACHLL